MTVKTTTASKSRSTDTIHVVKVGESLASIAADWFGSRDYAPALAQHNGLSPSHILYVGQRLILPALPDGDNDGPPTLPLLTAAPASPGGSIPVAYGDEIIETVTTTAPRWRWWQDWRVWAAGAGAMAVLWYLTRRRPS